jgi:ribokinase
MKPRICVIGSANIDLTFRTTRSPQSGETLAGRSLQQGMGGRGANQAVADVDEYINAWQQRDP